MASHVHTSALSKTHLKTLTYSSADLHLLPHNASSSPRFSTADLHLLPHSRRIFFPIDSPQQSFDWIVPLKLCKIDSEGKARKVVGCSCLVVKDYREESEGLHIVQEYVKSH
ncbi:putative ribosomal protein S12e [Helianthus anomalus]